MFKAKPLGPAVVKSLEDRKTTAVDVFDPLQNIRTNLGVYSDEDVVTKHELNAAVATMFTVEDYRKALITAREEETARSDAHNYCMRKISAQAAAIPDGELCVVCEDQPAGIHGYSCMECHQYVCVGCFPQSMSGRLSEDDNHIDWHYRCPHCLHTFATLSRTPGPSLSSAPTQLCRHLFGGGQAPIPAQAYSRNVCAEC